MYTDLGMCVTLYVLCAEASYRAAIFTARNVVEDIGATAAASSGGLLELSKVSEHHSERDGFRLLADKCGLALPVPLTTLPERVHVLRLRDWASMLAQKHILHMLVGLRDRDLDHEHAILESFWRHFKALFPEHQVFAKFEQGLNPRTCYPILYHGDEGRGRRRQSVLICNWHSVLGRGTMEQIKGKCFRHYVKLRMNFVGSSLVTRMLHAVCPKKLHQDPAIFQAIANAAASEAEFMVNEGIIEPYTNRQIHMAVLNVCGDWAFLHKIGSLKRSFNNVPKKLGDHQTGICHRCCAGAPGIPWELLHERDPLWLHTTFSACAFVRIPEICRFLHVPGEEERLLAFDLFHCFHLGVGKSVVGSALALLSQHSPGRNVDERVMDLEASFFAWCQSHGHSPVLTRLTKETILWPTTGDFPQASWYKPSLTTTFCKFLEGATNPC